MRHAATPTANPDWWRVDAAPAAAPAHAVSRAPSAGRITFGALVVYTVILVAAPQEFFRVLGPLRIALVVGLVALLAHAVDRMRGRVAAPRWPIEIRLVLCLFLWGVATVPFSYWPGGSVAVLTQLYLKSIALFILLSSVVDSTGRLRTISSVFIACAVVIAATALDHFRTGTISAGSGERIAGYGTSALAANPNDLALLLNMAIPINAALCLSARSMLWRMVGFAALAISAAGVVVTFSRAGFITLAFTGLLFLWRLFRQGSVLPAASVAAGAVVLALLMPAGYASRLSTVSDIDADATGSAQGRWRDTVIAAEFAARHPLVGAGAGMDYLALNDIRGAAWVSVHNVYLNYAVDLGLIGLGLFLAIYWSALRGVLAVERRREAAGRDDQLGSLATGVRIGLCSFGVAGLFHPIAYHAFFYYLAGLALAIRRIDSQERLAL